MPLVRLSLSKATSLAWIEPGSTNSFSANRRPYDVSSSSRSLASFKSTVSKPSVNQS
jgi:hypothetical protein